MQRFVQAALKWVLSPVEAVLQRACDYAVSSQSEENSSGRGQ